MEGLITGTFSWHGINLMNHSVKSLTHRFYVNSMVCNGCQIRKTTILHTLFYGIIHFFRRTIIH
ncbi:MAG: hypothetical protein IKJ81_08270 [Bacteroidales bacterium]|nr:hypothetical protein [Bacteroidales bacterium]